MYTIGQLCRSEISFLIFRSNGLRTDVITDLTIMVAKAFIFSILLYIVISYQLVPGIWVSFSYPTFF